MDLYEWLGDNQLAHDIWQKKYQHNGETLDEFFDRVSGGNEAVKKLIQEKKFCFGGRILANRGLQKEGRKITYSNCYVMVPPEDNIESIYDTASRLARTYSYGGGCGVDISNLAPRGAKINNAANTTSGAVSFMDTFSQVTEQIGQNGRRGALMISLDCHHPDLEEFIDIKTNPNKVTKANISVRITDDFMKAVENDEEFDLEFYRPESDEHITKTINARDVFKKLATNNWKMAEPGCLFWNRICNWNMVSGYPNFKYAGTNPCAEEPLPPGGSCNLGSLNLAEFVDEKGGFQWEEFKNAVEVAVVALNEVLEEGLPLHPLEEQRKSVSDWLQIGCGVMGLADALIKMKIRYGSVDSLAMCDQIADIMARSAILQSCRLAEVMGTFPNYNAYRTLRSEFFQAHVDEPETVVRSGMRNSQLLTIPPTGSIANLFGVSGAIEPIYANSYTRKTESLHGKDTYYKVYTPIVEEYMKSHGITNEEDLPGYFVTAKELNYKERIDMQAVWQKHIDASISSTVNLPNDITPEEVFELYMYAWKKGLKGITVYRDGCEREGILSEDKEDEIKNEFDEEFYIPRGMIETVPEGLQYRKYKLTTGCGQLYLFVGIDDYDNKIYDIYTATDGESGGGCAVNTTAVSRLISIAMRGGVPMEDIIRQLKGSGACPSYLYAKGAGKKVSRGKSCASAIATVLEDIVAELAEYERCEREELEESPMTEGAGRDTIIEEKAAIAVIGDVCPECGAELNHVGGCVECPECGWTKCN